MALCWTVSHSARRHVRLAPPCEAGRVRLSPGREAPVGIRPGGKEAAEVRAGDFFHIPVGLVHRDVNPSRKVDAFVVNVLLGEGPTVVNVAEP